MSTKLLSRADVMERLTVSESVLTRLLARGDLRSVKLGGRRLIPEDALEDYIATLAQSA